jgi:chlorite dismutase
MLENEVGLNVLHLFWRVNNSTDFGSIVRIVEKSKVDGVGIVTASMLGHRGDLCVMGLAKDPQLLRNLQTRLEQCNMELVYSYVSVTEVSEYAAGVPQEMKQARLYPVLPPTDKQAFCFYPMSKRRSESTNWYLLDYAEREQLMFGHGKVGRQFAGRILQLVTASTGLDDYEWGVTLFGVSLDTIKDCVYTMRFDPASAKYAEFGPFLTGVVGEVEDTIKAISV